MPGGAYSLLAFDLEGTDIAKWLNSIGVSAFIVKYRLPADYPQTWIALADAQRATRLVRNNAAACGIDPERIGVIGFSAGGHLASQLETRPSAATTPNVDQIDKLDARPDFGVLMYPVISMDPFDRSHRIAKQSHRLESLGVRRHCSGRAKSRSRHRRRPPSSVSRRRIPASIPRTRWSSTTRSRPPTVPEELHLYNDGAARHRHPPGDRRHGAMARSGGRLAREDEVHDRGAVIVDGRGQAAWVAAIATSRSQWT